MSEPKFGDQVHCHIPGMGATYEAVLGEMAYSTAHNHVILVATERTIGMPVNVKHCTVVGARRPIEARAYRDRYEQKFPGRLLPLPEETP